jgi:SAM-dependent methyltransferase
LDDSIRVKFYNEADDRRYGKASKSKYQPQVERIITSKLARHENSTEPFHVVELGCGRTVFTDIHPGYIGVDLSYYALTKFVPSKAVQGDMQALPFATESVDILFSIDAYEHVPEPELTLAEMARILKPGGVLMLMASWNVPRWTSFGLTRRLWSELSWRHRVYKALIRFRRTLLGRFLAVVPVRVFREAGYALNQKPMYLPFVRLQPNLSSYLESDSDAFTAVDAQSVMLWLKARGWEIVSHRNPASRILAREAVVVAVKAPQSRSQKK